MALYLARKLFKKRDSPEEHEPCPHEIAGTADIHLNAINQTTKDIGSTPTQNSPGQPENSRNSKTCPLCKQEKRDARKYRWKLIIGLLLPYLLASLDLTVVATALPFIASHFSNFTPLFNQQYLIRSR
jgi:hypothetical protein